MSFHKVRYPLVLDRKNADNLIENKIFSKNCCHIWILKIQIAIKLKFTASQTGNIPEINVFDF